MYRALRPPLPLFIVLVMYFMTTLPHGYAKSLKVKSRGELGTEGRIFLASDQDQGDIGNFAGVGRLYLTAKYDDFRLYLRGFGRHDGFDRKRSALFPEEAYLEYKNNPLRVRLGYQLQTWTATEAFHPADLINSRYLDGSVQAPEKRGELMGSARLKLWSGNIEAFIMPLFSAPIFPSEDSRFRFGPLGQSIGDLQILGRDGLISDDPWRLQYGARIQQTLFDTDLSLHFVRHIDRSLPIALITIDSSDPSAAPNVSLVYQALTQIGGTLQRVIGPVLFKAEAAYRDFEQPNRSQRAMLPPPPLFNLTDRDHTLIAIGLEYNLYHQTGESALLIEGQYAIWGEGKESGEGSLLLFDKDLLLGWRYAFNDVADRSLTTSVIIDMETPEQLFFNAVYAQRIGDMWRGELGLRLISYPPKDPDNPQGPEYIDQAHYAYTSLIRYF